MLLWGSHEFAPRTHDMLGELDIHTSMHTHLPNGQEALQLQLHVGNGLLNIIVAQLGGGQRHGALQSTGMLCLPM